MNWEISVFQLKLPTLITNAMKIINFDDVLCLLFKLAISKPPPSFWLILYGISGTKICFKKKTFHHVYRPSLGQNNLHKNANISLKCAFYIILSGGANLPGIYSFSVAILYAYLSVFDPISLLLSAFQRARFFFCIILHTKPQLERVW